MREIGIYYFAGGHAAALRASQACRILKNLFGLTLAGDSRTRQVPGGSRHRDCYASGLGNDPGNGRPGLDLILWLSGFLGLCEASTIGVLRNFAALLRRDHL
jgi:hypothetical protein